MPQTLKQEIKDKILRSALDGFLENGFRSTSMQEIAERAGIAAGNIYNYFRNKEEVFSTLIAPVLAEVKAIFGGDLADIASMSLMERLHIAQRKMDTFIRIYQTNRRVFVLLFEKSDSTKFETTKAEVIESLASGVVQAKNRLTQQPATPEQIILVHAFATAYINGVISILLSKGDEETKLKALHQFLPFMRNRLIHNLR